MANNAAAMEQEIAMYTNYLRANYCNLSARVLYIWDYCATFHDEVKYIWGRGVTPATIIFMVNRYVNLLIAVLELLEQAPFQTMEVTTDPFLVRTNAKIVFSCKWVVRILQTCLILALFIVSAFATLRVYAIWHRSWKVALPVLILSLVPPAINIMIDSHQATTTAPPPSTGCAVFNEPSNSPEVFSKLIIVNRATTTAYEGIVFILTVMRSAQLYRRDSHVDAVHSGVICLLLRDGAIYFLFLLALNLSQIVVSAHYAGNNYVSYYVSPVTAILISRALLDLCSVASPEQIYTSNESSSVYLTSELQSTQYRSEKGFEGLAGPHGTTFRSFVTTEGSSTAAGDNHRECLDPEILTLAETRSASEYVGEKDHDPGPSSKV